MTRYVALGGGGIRQDPSRFYIAGGGAIIINGSPSSGAPINGSADSGFTLGMTATVTVPANLAATSSFTLGQTATGTVPATLAASQSLAMGMDAAAAHGAVANATATSSFTLGIATTGGPLIQGLATSSFTMGMTAAGLVIPIPINATATSSFSLGQTATATGLVQAVAASSFTMGQTATGVVLPGPINATVTASFTMGQDAIAATTFFGQCLLNWNFQTGVYNPPISQMTFTRSGIAWAQNAAGDLIQFASGVARITDLGIWNDETRTNSITNNTAAGGSAGVAPTNWTTAFSGGLTGITTTWIGGGSEGNIEYFDVRLQGTPSATGNALIAYETGTAITAATGQTWGHSAFLKIVGGSATNTNLWRLAISENTSGGAFVAQRLFDMSVPATSGALGLNRRTCTHVTAGGGTVARVQPYTMFGMTSGQAIDITIRIGLPQFELASATAAFCTSPIKTSSGAVTRNGEWPLLSGANFAAVFNQTEGTIYVSGTPQAGSGNSRRFLDIDDGTTAERYVISQSVTAGQGRGLVTDGGVSQADMFPATVTALAHNRLAMAYKANDFAIVANNGTPVTDTAGTLPTPTQMSIGIDHAGSAASSHSGPIRHIALHGTRVPNTVLGTITAPTAATISATATSSFTLGMTAAANVFTPISATATGSFVMGQTATVTVLVQAQATTSLSMGMTATAVVIPLPDNATATSSFAMGITATAVHGVPVLATAGSSFTMGMTTTGGPIVKAQAVSSFAFDIDTTGGPAVKGQAVSSFLLDIDATVAHGAVSNLTASSSFAMSIIGVIVRGGVLGGPPIPLEGSLDLNTLLLGGIDPDLVYGDIGELELEGDI